MKDKRLSRLCDRLATHIVYKRDAKALKIAQYLRAEFGDYILTAEEMNIRTGQSTPKNRSKK